MDPTLFSTKGFKPVMAVLAGLTVLQAAMIIIQGYFLADAISSLFGGDLFHSSAGKLGIFLGALVLRHFLAMLKRKLAFRFAAETSTRLREQLLRKLFVLGPRFAAAEGSGQTVTLLMEGIPKYRRYLELFLPKLASSILIPAAVCGFVFFQNVRSAAILIIALPILIVFMILLGLAAKEKASRQYSSYQVLANHFVDSLRGLETLKNLGISRRHAGKIGKVSEQYRKATMSTLRFAFLSSFALEFFTMLSVATVAVFLGLELINGTMELQTALTVLILAPEYFLPIREVGADFHATLDGKEAGGKIRSILEKEGPAVLGNEGLPDWKADSKLTVENLRLPYAALDGGGISFTVTGAKKIGIIGASGAGKSTLIDVLSGFLQAEADRISIDGKRLSSFANPFWQKQLTYIPQHPYVFSGSLLENIRFYQPEATEAEVREAADSAGLSNIIARLPEGIHTLIGEGGRMLSGGQEQRVALARAFLGSRPVTMLDEPTAHLDIETEYELKQTMLNLFEGKLVFLATHRLHWMRDMDFILVLDEGKLAESGTHEELLARKGFYYKLCQAQMEGWE
ncbi:thiol reductant ABC exporter subunit CydD [Bacillus sp. B-jedd]|uniref:thiol reductant ABC exporter subunit CydD n=1 Tax=Bacillus sp. B-jedd TaxID=1476857 RepID=UPI0005156B59|nr:thiol reductant ABC exporter subunit CydD [Bacillus sp. B-jedd]CEG26148.1 ABC transporter ATP-binding protein [Bacillus sp. B-jedd]